MQNLLLIFAMASPEMNENEHAVAPCPPQEGTYKNIFNAKLRVLGILLLPVFKGKKVAPLVSICFYRTY